MLRLIVVDDEKGARDNMVHYIDKEKYGIQILGTASDGIEACALIQAHAPDIVLIDIEMPGMNGLQVIDTVFNQYGMTSVVFIIVSSYENFSYAREALRLGVNDYLLKPFLPSDICDAIYRAAKHIHSVQSLMNAPESPHPIAGALPPLPGRKIRMNYPCVAEQEIIRQLHTQDEAQVSAALDAFLKEIKGCDDELYWNCLVILYLEICHFSITRNMRLDEFGIAMESCKTPLEFSNAIRQLCAALCQGFGAEKRNHATLVLALRYIDEHYASPLTLEGVAQEAYVSPAYLSTLFTRSLNMHFVDYIHKVRIENAIRLMKESPQMKYYEVSERVGYSSYKHFAKCFKKVMHITLSQYQTQISKM